MNRSPPHRRSPGLRAYDALRVAVLHGDLPAGRIDIQQVASRLGVSPTPVREALARMATEQLILFSPGHGYAVAHLSPKALCDLYVWSDRVIRLAVDLSFERGADHGARFSTTSSNGPTPLSSADYAQHVSAFFDEIAQASGNGECISKIAESNDRLFRARTVEWSVLEGATEELYQLALRRGGIEAADLSGGITNYFQRRIEHCEAIALTLSQLGAGQA